MQNGGAHEYAIVICIRRVAQRRPYQAQRSAMIGHRFEMVTVIVDSTMVEGSYRKNHSHQ